MKLFYECVRQYDSTDCASACVATIARYYGKRIPLADIRQHTEMMKDGATVYEICMAAERIGLSAIALVRTESFNDSQMAFPCVAHVYQEDGAGHFIILYKIKKNDLIAADPAIGIIKINKNDFWNCQLTKTSPYIWSGAIIALNPNEKFGSYVYKREKKEKDDSIYRTIIKSQIERIVKITFLSILAMLITITTSFYFGTIVDKLIPNHLIYSLLAYTVAMIVLIIVKVSIDWKRVDISLKVSKAINLKLCLRYYKHILNLPLSILDTRKSGEFISRFQDASQVQEALITGILVVPVDVIFIIVVGVMLGYKSINMFLIVLLICLSYSIIALLFKGKYSSLNSLQRIEEAKVTTHLVDSMEGIQTIKSYGIEERLYEHGSKKILKWQDKILNVGYAENFQAAIKIIINSLGEVTILSLGAYEVMNGKLSIGELITYNILIGYLLAPIKDIINLQPLYHSAKIAMERLQSIIDIDEEKDGTEFINKIDSIEFRNVSYGFNSYSKAIELINIKITAGTTVAIVGSTGSGKTTLARLLIKFYQPSDGEIYFNNRSIDLLSTKYVRQVISYVSQEEFIFTGSVRENLLLGNHNICDNQMKMVCKKIGVDEFVNTMSRGYESLLDERGTNLSKGQKQKIALARAILKKPEILILDEATSNMDAISEKKVLEYIKECGEMTVIM